MLGRTELHALTHGKGYDLRDAAIDFGGGALARTFSDVMTPGDNRYMDLGYQYVDPSFAGAIIKQEVFMGGYEAIRGGFLSSDAFTETFDWIFPK